MTRLQGVTETERFRCDYIDNVITAKFLSSVVRNLLCLKLILMRPSLGPLV